MTRSLFGTDGVRGRANASPMTAEIAMRIGMAAGRVFNRGGHRHRVVVGKDTRLQRLHDRAGPDRRLPVGRRRRAAARAAADAGGRLPDALDARRRRRHDLGLAQSLRGQRHQAVRPGRLQALRRGRDADRARWSRATPTSRWRRRPRSAAPSASTTPRAATSRRSRHRWRAARPGGPQDRRRLRQWRRLQGRADRAVGARRRRDPGRASIRTASTSTATAARPIPACCRSRS